MPSVELKPLDIIWIVIGFVGQLLFTGRFIVQWLASERKGESVVPVAFWWLSLGGGSVLLAYALYKRDPVFIVGQLTGLFVYTRNLALIQRRLANKVPAPPAAEASTQSNPAVKPRIAA